MRKPQKEIWKTLNDVFDIFTERTIHSLITKGVIDGLESPLSIGKESNVFTAKKGNEKVAVKIYRLQTADFNKMYSYIKSDPRFLELRHQRRKIIFEWCKREYKNLLIAIRGEVRVPHPKAFANNTLAMSLIGGEAPAPKLSVQKPKNPEEFYKKVLREMKKLYDAGLVHADLSQFNILNYDENPVLIDLSHATTFKDPNAEEWLRRDCKNVANYFKKIGLNITEEEVHKEIVGNSKKND
ncbi:serine protein kinase RIO [Candidatus Woesearchaeota archaeon]|nr:serine protein kinase RIO [Candidatus Woesearchaeota archaeon]